MMDFLLTKEQIQNKNKELSYGGCRQGFLVYNKSVAHYTSL